MKLNDLALKYDTDKKMDDGKPSRNGVMGHNYTQYYEIFLNKIKVNRLLEIGVSFGSSIKMWSEYLPDAEIVGVDINTKRFNPKDLNQLSNVKIIIADATKKIDNLGKFDIIIDDGSHRDMDIISSLYNLWGNLNEGGIYVVEDLHVSNKNNPFSAINMIKQLDLDVKVFENNTIAFIGK